MKDDEYAAISRAVREAIDDAYRLGIGAAIKVADEQLAHHPQNIALEAVIVALRRLSAQAGLLPPPTPKEQP